MIRVLLEDVRAPHPLTPDYLNRSVSPFLAALGVLQMVADVIQQRDDPLTIERITSEKGRLTADVNGADAAIRFAEREIPAWRQTHIEAIRTMRELDQMLTWLTDTETQEKILLERDDLRLSLQPDMLRLAINFLSQVSPDAPPLGQVMYVDRLMSSFHLLAISTISLVVIAL